MPYVRIRMLAWDMGALCLPTSRDRNPHGSRASWRDIEFREARVGRDDALVLVEIDDTVLRAGKEGAHT